MAPQTHHQHTQTLLLMQKILSKPESSPLTLVLDSVEQGAAGLVKVVVGVAKASKTHTIYISPTSLNAPSEIDTHITSRRKTPETLKTEILASIPQNQKTLLILSPLPPALYHPTCNLPTYLLSLLSPTTTMLLIHHVDIPIPTPQNPHPPQQNPYTPPPLPLLLYTATTILTLSSLPQTLLLKRAHNTALAAPQFGLDEDTEGVLVGKGANAYSLPSYSHPHPHPHPHTHTQGIEKGGIIITLDHRRKSGRSVTETFVLPSPLSPTSTSAAAAEIIKKMMVLDRHPLFVSAAAAPAGTGSREDGSREDGLGKEGGGDIIGTTFELGLSAKQRRDREGVVLPYYDAQRRGGDGGGGGGGEGGRILYEMGVEDDFDEEEDEV